MFKCSELTQTATSLKIRGVSLHQDKGRPMRQILLCFALTLGMVAGYVEPPVVQAAAKQRAVVSGTGKTESQAVSNAKDQAFIVSSGKLWREINRTKSGTEPNITVTLVIEY